MSDGSDSCQEEDDRGPPMHQGQIELSLSDAKRLIAEQFPQWSDLEVAPVRGTGTVSRIFRIGEQLSARFPLVVDDPESLLESLRAEAHAAEELLGKTRVRSPAPVAFGRPGPGFPGPWMVCTWVEGVSAAEVDLSRSPVLVHDLVEFITDVRRIPLRGRSWRGRGRGGDLRSFDSWMETCFENGRDLLDVPPLRALWSELRDLPRIDPDVMTHGDLLPGNLLVDGERLVGVLDPGNLGPADPALDLMGTWSLFDSERRQLLRAELRCTDLEWARGRAWAFEQAMGASWYYVKSNPTMSRLALRALNDILVDGTS